MTRIATDRRCRTALIVLPLFLLSCGDEERSTEPLDPQVASVEVSPEEARLTALEATEDFEATATGREGTEIPDVDFSWSVSPEEVASIDDEGTATAEAVGTATVTAEADGETGTAELTVEQEVAAVEVSPDSVVSEEIGETVQFDAMAEDAASHEIPDADFTWSTSDPTVATVDDSGLATTEAEGSTSVTASTDGVEGAGKLVVRVADHPPYLRRSFRGVEGFSMFALVASGPHSLVVARNDRIALRDKNGSLIDDATMEDFFAEVRPEGAHGGGTDPRLLYDPDSGRFFVVISQRIDEPDCEPGDCVAKILLAVSRSSNPSSLGSGEWHLYALDRTVHRTSEGTEVRALWGDFDTLGAVGNTLAIGMIIYPFREEVLGPPEQSMIRILDKSRLVAGESVDDWTDFVVEDEPDRMMVARTVGQDPGRVFGVTTETHRDLNIHGISDLDRDPEMTTRNVPLFGPDGPDPPPDATQPGESRDIRVAQLSSQPVVVNGSSLWITSVYGHNFGSGQVSTIWVFEIDVSGWPHSANVVQSIRFGEDGVDHFAPAVMVDESNDLTMVYNRSGPDEYASLYFTGRSAGDPHGNLHPGKRLKAGETIFEIHPGDFGDRNLFGFYYDGALDPVDSTIWIHGFFARDVEQTPGQMIGARGSWVGNVTFEF